MNRKKPIPRAELVKLEKKIKKGKTLSPTERNKLASPSPIETRFALNQTELAQILNVARKTIQRAIKDDGHPETRADGRMDVAEWRAFLAQRGSIASDSEVEPKVRQILLQNEKLEFNIGILRKEYVRVEDVERMGAQTGASIRKIVSSLHLSAADLVGLSVPEAETRLKEMEDEILNQIQGMNDQIKKIKTDVQPAE